MIIKLPNEDNKTIDVDIRKDRVIMFSHKYKCSAIWDRPVSPGIAKAVWDGEQYLLRITAPIQISSRELSF